MDKIPHPIPYQGSKRNLAPAILSYISNQYETLYEPFAGSASLSLYAAYHNYARHFVIGDTCSSIINLWHQILHTPQDLITRYAELWHGQQHGDFDYFNRIRDEYNRTYDPVLFLYLAARCVKNAIRFNRYGRFTQSVDKRRKGMHPDKMQRNVLSAHYLLAGRTTLFQDDFKDCLEPATHHDLIYMDPPYQGTTYGRDKRYFQQLEKDDLVSVIYDLNTRNIDFLLSYDGSSGERQYGEPLPSTLEMSHILINAGRSSQATLNGKNAQTVESLYISRRLGNGITRTVL